VLPPSCETINVNPNMFSKVYTAFDVTCCTVSILHLCAVSIDRYYAIVKVTWLSKYIQFDIVFFFSYSIVL
jgi:hypothetical protein